MRRIFLYLSLILLISLTAFSQSWTKLDGPYGGQINKIFQHPSSENIFAATPRGLYQYDDVSRWNPVSNQELSFNYVSDIFYHEASGEIYVNVGQIYRSTNGGNSWNNLGINVPFYINHFVRDNDGFFFISGYDQNLDEYRLFYSNNGGSTWTDYGADFPGYIGSLTFYEYSGIQYLLVSSNGKTFLANITSSLDAFSEVLVDGSNTFEIFDTSKGSSGELYIAASHGGLILYDPVAELFTTLNTEVCSAVEYISNDDILFGSSDGKIYNSVDGGLNFTIERPVYEPYSTVSDLEETSIGTLAGTTRHRGLLRKQAGVWSGYNEGIQGYYLYNFIIDTINTDPPNFYISSNEGGLYRGTDLGTSWDAMFTPMYGGSIQIDPYSGDIFSDNHISTDQGVTWTNLSNSPGYINGMAFDPNGDIIAFVENNGIMKSSDQGVSWDLLYADNSNDRHRFLVASDGTYYVVRRNDYSTTSPLIMRSTDQGATWTNITNGLSWPCCNDVLIKELSSGIYISGYGGIYKTSDKGDTWIPFTTQPFFGSENGINDIEEIEGITFVIQSSSISTTVDDGISWKRVKDYGYREVRRILSYGSDVYFAFSNGLAKFDNPVTAIEVPSDFKVQQISSTNVGVWWTSGEVNSGYRLLESTNGGSSFNLITDTLTTTQYLSLEGNTSETIYRLEVKNEFALGYTQDTIQLITPETPIYEISPADFGPDDEVTITYYNENRAYPIGELTGSSKVYFYSGVTTKDAPFEWKNVTGNINLDDGIGEMSLIEGETDVWEFTFVPRDYFGITPDQFVGKLAFLFVNEDATAFGKNEFQGDFYEDFYNPRYVYDFDGDLTDSEGNADAIASNTPEFVTDRQDQADMAIRFDGDDVIKIPFMPAEGAPFSVSYWVYRSVNASYQYLDFGVSGPWLFNQNSTLYVYDDNYIVEGNMPGITTGWDQFTITYDGTSNMQLYSNGELSGENSAPYAFLDSLRLGRDITGYANLFSGKMDNLIIDPYVISAEEVWSRYQNFNPPDNFQVSPGGDQTINYSFDNIGRTADYYVYRNNVELSVFTDGGDYTDNTVLNGQYYDYYLYTIDDLGNVSRPSATKTGITFGGLEAYYDFDSYSPMDQGPNNYNANTNSTFQVLSTDRFGQANDAFFFQTESDSTWSSQTFADDAVFSISIWARWTNESNLAFQPLVSWSDPANTTNAFLAVSNSGELIFTDNWTNTGVFLNRGKWTHIVATYDGAGAYELHLDGQSVASLNGSAGLQFGSMFIGSEKMDGGEISYFNGHFDDFTLFSTTITQSDIDALYGVNGWPGTQFRPTSHDYAFNPGSGTFDQIIFAFEASSTTTETLTGIRFDVANGESFENFRLYRSSTLGSFDVYLGQLTYENGELSNNNLSVTIDNNELHYTIVADVKVSGDDSYFVSLNKADIQVQDPTLLFGEPTFTISGNISGVESGLLAYYPFSGNTRDESGNNHHGTLIGAAPAADRFKKDSKAYYFDGVDDLIWSDVSSSFETFTFSAWVNPKNTDLSGNHTIMSFGNGDPWFALSNGIPTLSTTSALGTVETDTWTHLAVTYDGANTRFYIDGELDQTLSGNLIFNGSYLAIGQGTIFADGFNDGSTSFVSTSISGEQVWSDNNFGLKNSSSFFMNGYDTDPVENEDWLVSPAIDLNDLSNPFFSFYSDVRFVGPELNVLISSDYSGNVATATWTELSATWDTNTDSYGDWVFSGEMDLSSYVDNHVNIAFQYTSTDTEAASWSIDNFLVQSPGDQFSGLIDEVRVYGKALTEDQLDYLFEKNRNGLIAHFPFDGNAVDLIDGNDGVINGSPEFTSDRFNSASKAISILSAEDFVEVSDSEGYDLDEDFSIDLWFKTSNNLANQAIFSKYSDDSQGIQLIMNTEGFVNFLLYDGAGNNATILSSVPWDDDRWHKLLATKNDESAYLYVDGIFLGETDLSALGSLNVSDPIFIGSSSTGISTFFGVLDEVKIYDKFIYPSDIDQNLVEGYEGFIYNEDKKLSFWNIGSPNTEVPRGMIEDSDGNILIVAYGSEGGDFAFGYGSSDIKLIKISPSTNEVLWTTTIGGDNTDFGWEVTQATNGDYLVIGYTLSNTDDFVNLGDRDVAVARISNNGDLIWSRTLGGPSYDTGRGIVELSDGTIGISGATNSVEGDFINSGSVNTSDIFFARLSANGALMESYVYGDPVTRETAWDMKIAGDGSVLIAGSTSDPDGWVLKINPFNGAILWENTFGGSGYDDGWALAIDKNDNVLLTGSSSSTGGNIPGNSGLGDAYIAKMAGGTGNILWVKTYGGPGEETSEGIAASHDGYYLTGSTNSSTGVISTTALSTEQFFAKIDYDGNLIYSYSYGSENADYANDIIVTNDQRVYSVGTQRGEDGDFTFYRGNFDILVINHFSDHGHLFALNIEGQETPPTIDYSNKTIDVSTIKGTDLDNLNVFYEGSPYSYIVGKTLKSSIAGTLISDFASTQNMYVEYQTGIITSSEANPGTNEINSSTEVGKYVRNGGESYDVLAYRSDLFENAQPYYQGDKVFKIDIYTDAPVGTEILLQLENHQRNMFPYPAGRLLNLSATTTVQNEWETLVFSFSNLPEGGISNPYEFDQLVFLFDSGNSSDNTYYLSNFKSEVVDLSVPTSSVSLNSGANTLNVSSENGRYSETWTLNLTPTLYTENEILNMEVNGLILESLSINNDANSIVANVSTSVDITQLAPTFDLSPGATINPASGTTRNFSNNANLSYTVTSENGVSSAWTLQLNPVTSTATNFLGFTMDEAVGDPVFNNNAGTIAINVTGLSEVSNLTVSDYELSFGASVSPDPLGVTDYSSPQSFDITAEDGSTKQTWTVTVTRVQSSEANIVSFDADGLIESTVSINNNDTTLVAAVTTLEDITALNVTIGVSDFANITSPDLSNPLDFSNPVEVVVEAEDGTKKIWTITLSQQISNEAKITSFTFEGFNGDIEINPNASPGDPKIVAYAYNGVSLTNLVPIIGYSAGATSSYNGTDPLDFSSTVTVTVTAQDGVTQTSWLISVVNAARPEMEITSFVIPDIQVGDEDISASSITVFVKYGSDLTTITPVIISSEGTTVTPSGPQDFTSLNPRDYTVTADPFNNTTYAVSVLFFEGNGSGGGEGGDFTAAISSPPTTYQIGSGGFDVDFELNPANGYEGGFHDVMANIRKVNDPNFGSEPLEKSSTGGKYSRAFTDGDFNALGVQYFYEATDDFGFTQYSDTITTTAIISESSEQNSIEKTHAKGRNQTDYRMISLPFDETISHLFDEFEEKDNTKWRLLTYTGIGETPFSEVNYSANAEAGEGYWFIHDTDNTSINFGGNHLRVTGGIVKKQLRAEWNLIGNPFHQPLDWDLVLQHNIAMGIISDGDIGVLHGFGGDAKDGIPSFTKPNELEEFEGAYVENKTGDPVNFEFPISAVVSGSSSGRKAYTNEVAYLDEDEWNLTFKLNSYMYGYHIGSFGLKNGASDKLDKFDATRIPQFDTFLRIDFDDSLSSSFKSPDSFKKWTFTIPNNMKDEYFELSWSEINSIYNTVLLVDGITKRIIDMTAETGIKIKNKPGAVHNLYYGDKEDIYNHLDLDFISIQSLFPNPVTMDMTFDIYSPEDQEVTYEIVSVEGKISFVETIKLQKGLNRINLDKIGKKLADGIYLLNLEGFDNQLVMRKFIVK